MVTSPLLLALLLVHLLPAAQTSQPAADATPEAVIRQLEQQLADTLRTKPAPTWNVF